MVLLCRKELKLVQHTNIIAETKTGLITRLVIDTITVKSNNYHHFLSVT